MTPESWPVGQKVRASVRFRNNDGVIADPENIVAKIEAPSGADTVYTYGTDSQLVRTATGRYYVDVIPGASGTWTVRFNGTGTSFTTAREVAFIAEDTVF